MVGTNVKWKFSSYMSRRLLEPDYIFKKINFINLDLAAFSKLGNRINDRAHQLNTDKIPVTLDQLIELKSLLESTSRLMSEVISKE